MITKFKLYNESYYEDLTPFEYGMYALPECVNIGWLDKRYPFEKGEVPDGFVERLKNLPIIMQHTGPYICEFCDKNVWSTNVRFVKGDYINYLTPSMISHYVEVHNYKPPQEFIDAVMNMNMTQKEAIQLLNNTIKKYAGDLPMSKYLDTIKVER